MPRGRKKDDASGSAPVDTAAPIMSPRRTRSSVKPLPPAEPVPATSATQEEPEYVPSGDDASDSDIEYVFTTKKSTSKSKVGGKAPAKGKGKGRAKKVDSDWESGSEVDVRQAKKPKGTFCKIAKWKDIPSWSGRKDCPLLDTIPAEIMDKIFGLNDDLATRDYLALSGVNSFFRHHLNDEFFRELYHTRKEVLRPFFQGNRPFNIFDLDTGYLSSPSPDPAQETSSEIFRDRLFSRTLDAWRVDPPTLTPALTIANTYYVPAGERSSWTREQYERYKREKALVREENRIKRQEEMQQAVQEMREQRRKGPARIKVGGESPRVQAVVWGRLDGEPALVKDPKRGVPVADQPVQVWADGKKRAATADGDGDIGGEGKEGGGKRKLRGEDWEEIAPPAGVTLKKAKRSRTTKVDVEKEQEWTVPDTDEEADSDMPVLGGKKDEQGKWVLHDYWPSEWRTKVAEMINQDRITATTALKEFKVEVSDLLGLKCMLTNNAKSSSMMFIKAAVQALELRKHGGAAGVQALEDEALRRRQEQAKKQREKDIEALKNGTFVYRVGRKRPKRKNCYGHEWDDEGFCWNCGKEDLELCHQCGHEDHKTTQCWYLIESYARSLGVTPKPPPSP